MSMTVEDTDLVVLEQLDFDARCSVLDCERPAAWSVTWSCGCLTLYCAQCWNVFLANIERGVEVRCDGPHHGIAVFAASVVSL